MGKVHDQIKAVLGAWGEWTSKCPCHCDYCVELDKALSDLVNAWALINTKPENQPQDIQRIAKRPSKRYRPAVIMKRVLKAFDEWCTECSSFDKNKDYEKESICCKFCAKLTGVLIDLQSLIEAGPEEEKE